MSFKSFAARVLLALALAVAGGKASADARIDTLVGQLKSDDYRVRTQAALGLGTTGDPAAVKPLCDGLGDRNVSVRVAAAAALGKLGKATGLPCLQAAAKQEITPSVKTQIDKSIAAVQTAVASAGPATPPPPSADSKYYVAIQVENKTARPAAEVDALVREAIQNKLLATKGYAVAPKGETVAQGGQIIKSRKLMGFLLIATVEPPVYKDGALAQVVRVSMWTYPSKELQGEFNPKLTQKDTPTSDRASEEVLVKMCSDSAVETFRKVVASR